MTSRTAESALATVPGSSADAELLHSVRLACVPGVGARMRQILLERFGSAEAVFAATSAEIASIPGIGRKLPSLIPSLTTDPTAERMLELCRSRGVGIIRADSDAYPGLLSRIDDPPPLLFVRGSLEPCDALAGGLARAGYTVVSGLARGIDAAAHRGALDAGGRTIAVLGTGVLHVYPPEHADLAVEVIGRGALVSEAPPLSEPFRGAFPQRNRIVSGMSLGTIVVEAADRSGALITARLAGEQGREVFAVPGPIDSRMSRGCNQLIRDGATLVQGIDDVLEELGPLFEATTTADGRTVQSPAELQLADVERDVLAAIDSCGGATTTAADIDEIVATSGLTASQVLSTIGVLEMRRIIRRLPGNRVARA